jgi:hypothetical protein
MTERHKRSRGISRADVQGIGPEKRNLLVGGRMLPDEQGEIRADLMPQDQIDAFVRRHFTWPGTLRLHRAAVGGDIWRSPANVFLSPVFVLTRLAAWICDRLRLAGAAVWLRNRRLQVRTAVAAKVEAAVLTELLDVPLERADTVPDREALCRAILAAPEFREVIRRRGTVAGTQIMAARIAGVIGDYASTRSAIAEFTTALITLAIGAIVFQAVTPGVISMAPGVAEAVSHGTAIADFPLGSTLGGVWYGVFPVGPSPWLIVATGAGLLILGSLVTAFAGIIADPVQAHLGIHRRRLLRLFDTLDAELRGSDDRPFAIREHLLARIFDLWDAALSLLRMFRS